MARQSIHSKIVGAVVGAVFVVLVLATLLQVDGGPKRTTPFRPAQDAQDVAPTLGPAITTEDCAGVPIDDAGFQKKKEECEAQPGVVVVGPYCVDGKWEWMCIGVSFNPG